MYRAMQHSYQTSSPTVLVTVWDLSPSLTTPGNMITADTWNWYSAPFCSMPTTPQLALPGNCTGEVGPCLRLRPPSGAEMKYTLKWLMSSEVRLHETFTADTFSDLTATFCT